MLTDEEIMAYVQDTTGVSGKKQLSLTEAKQIGDALGIVWDKFGVEQFRAGLNVELRHGSRDPVLNHDEPMLAGKIAWAHLNDIPDYYTQ